MVKLCRLPLEYEEFEGVENIDIGKWMSSPEHKSTLSEIKLIRKEEIPEQMPVKFALFVSNMFPKFFDTFLIWHKIVRSMVCLSRFLSFMKCYEF